MMTIQGIIVGELEGKGVVLLCHKSAPSLTFVIDSYLDRGSTQKLWYALFSLDAFHKNGKPFRIKKVRALVGSVVCCKVEKSESQSTNRGQLTNWIATMVEEVQGVDRHLLPKFNLQRRKTRKHRSSGPQIQRLSRLSEGVANNLHRPWQG